MRLICDILGTVAFKPEWDGVNREMELSLAQKQKQVLSAQMIQSVKVLQMGAQELLQYVQETVEENPMLELEDPYSRTEEDGSLAHRLEWLASSDLQNRTYYRQDFDSETDPLRNYGTVDDSESLYVHILNQLDGLTLAPDVLQCCKFLAGCLDANGWLDECLAQLAHELDWPEQLLEDGLAVLQSLDPPGVGARSLSECLCLQLAHGPQTDETALRIARDHLEGLAKNHYGQIARTLGISQEEVRRAAGYIRTLAPRPGTKFSAQEAPSYVMPDVIVERVADHFEVRLNDRFLPSLNISPYYTRMLRESDDSQVKDYLINRMRQAEWTVRTVEQRRSTLMACAGCILEFQEDFFRRGPGYLRPLSLANVAQRLEIHESTVSRAISGKYLQCSMGAYPLHYFFSRQLASAQAESLSSPDAAKALLKALIAQEDKSKPMSDQKLCQCMAERGCVIARRTVAKYRGELGIPGATGRKQYGSSA